MTVIHYCFAIGFGSVLLLFCLTWLIMCLKGIVVVKKETSMIVERWGRFSRRLDAGIHLLLPFADRRRTLTWRWTESELDPFSGQVQTVTRERNVDRIDMREAVMDLPFQSIITRDNVEIHVHPMLLCRIHDPVRAAYEVYDIFNAVERIVQTSLRAIVGDMGLDDTLASREEINKVLTHKISNIMWNWGVQLRKVELLEINPSTNVLRAMHKQLAAERVRRAAIIRSDGFREKTKTEAEGECQAQIAISKGRQQTQIIRARALADCKLILARAEAEALRTVAAAIGEFATDPTQYMVALKYIETFTELATNAQNRKIYFPFESHIVGSLKDTLQTM
eukprot:gnl/Trimastix_PCT/589.p1 GENE.gnl/Trimastix_PCT/589~~gnl/Trimastix_PCT/589.p1  ORF type:complete len:362 (-),score=104.00 gnl/Trimastix_PCT/589:56-1066(-)